MTRPKSLGRRNAARFNVWCAGGVAVLTLTSPIAGATTYRAPFTHFKATSYNYVQEVSGCATARSSIPRFVGLTGNGTWSGHASATTCRGALQSNQTLSYGQASGASEVAAIVHVPAGATHATSISVTWNFTASGSASLKITKPCPTPILVNGTGTSICVAQAVAMVLGDAWLVDLTNGTMTAAYNSPISLGQYNTSENTTRCTPNCTSGTYAYAGGSAFSGPSSATFDISAVTNSSHQYAIVTYLGGTVSAQMQGYGGKATGSVNLQSGANRFQLVSIVIT